MRQVKINKQITNREFASLDKYLQEIGREGLITAEEEVGLAKKIHAGDAAALDKMVRANLRFVVSVSKQYQNQGLSLPDLINEGNLGLIKAAGRFDETRGFKFISYAVWWIRQSILQALANQARVVRLPMNIVGLLNKINKKISNLEQIYEREPTDEEIANALGKKIEDVKDIMRSSSKPVSLDKLLSPNEESSASFGDMSEDENAIKPDQDLMTDALSEEIGRSLQTLNNRERDIVRLFFGLNGQKHGLTLEEIGVKFDLTRERVRQIKEKAVRKLRHPSRSKLLRTYLG